MINKKTFLLILAISISVIGILAVAGVYVYRSEYRKPLFDVHFFSLNKGRSIFIRTPENKTFLIGGGQNSEVVREITKVMPFYKRKIDYIVIPSAIPAQIGGLIEVVRRYDIGEAILPKIMATSTVLSQLKKEIRSKKIHVKEVKRGDSLEIEENLLMNVFFPYEGFKFNKTSLPELGFSISFGSSTVYFLGNLSKTIQKDILKNLLNGLEGEKVKDDQNLVEFYNNASGAKISEEFLETIKPQFIFSTNEKTSHYISDGEVWNKK